MVEIIKHAMRCVFIGLGVAAYLWCWYGTYKWMTISETEKNRKYDDIEEFFVNLAVGIWLTINAAIVFYFMVRVICWAWS